MSNMKTLQGRSLYKEIFKVATPIAIQGVVSAILGLMDSLMVGFLGASQLAAVGIAMQIFFIHYLLLFGFIGGTATFIAQYYGKGDHESIRKTIGFAITVAMGIAVVFFIVGFFFPEEFLGIYVDNPQLKHMAAKYMKIGSFTFITLAFSGSFEMGLKATKQTTAPMLISSLAFGLNTLLNFIFIFGKLGVPAMGIEGAALATVFCRLLEALLSIIYCMSNKNKFRCSILSYAKWNLRFIKPIVKNCIPTTLNDFLWSIGQSMYVAAFARVGTVAFAGYQIAASVASIFVYAAMSVGDTILIIVGEELGKGLLEEAYAMSKKLLRIGLGICIIIGVVLVLTGDNIVNTFCLSKDCLDCGYQVMIVLGITLPISQLVQMFKIGISRSGGDTTFAMIVDSAYVWILGVPMAFFTAVYLGLPMPLSVLIVKLQELFEVAVFYHRFKSKKWLHNLV